MRAKMNHCGIELRTTVVPEFEPGKRLENLSKGWC